MVVTQTMVKSKRLLKFKSEEGCVCQRCGRRYKVDLNIPNDLWKEIRPIYKEYHSGLLCGPCIMERIEQINKFAAYKLSKI